MTRSANDSIFKVAKQMATALLEPIALTPENAITKTLAQDGCHHPLFVVHHYNPGSETNKTIQEKSAKSYGRALAGMLRHAFEDSTGLPVQVRSVVWENEKSDGFIIGLGVGSEHENDQPLQFTAVRQLGQALDRLKTKLIGTKDQPATQWLETKINSGLQFRMPEPAYLWEASTPRDKELVTLMTDIARARGYEVFRDNVAGVEKIWLLARDANLMRKSELSGGPEIG